MFRAVSAGKRRKGRDGGAAEEIPRVQVCECGCLPPTGHSSCIIMVAKRSSRI